MGKEIRYLAYTDHLTGIANRLKFEKDIKQSLSRAKRYQRYMGILLIDLDHFKKINETLGHHIGDLLLKEVVFRFQQSLRESDLITRLGGDEFAIILDELAKPADAAISATRLLQNLKSPIKINEHTISISASIGIACYPGSGRTLQDLYQHADIALYRAKDSGRNTYHFFFRKLTEGFYRAHSNRTKITNGLV